MAMRYRLVFARGNHEWDAVVLGGLRIRGESRGQMFGLAGGGRGDLRRAELSCQLHWGGAGRIIVGLQVESKDGGGWVSTCNIEPLSSGDLLRTVWLHHGISMQVQSWGSILCHTTDTQRIHVPR
jgi:hypothetical protein